MTRSAMQALPIVHEVIRASAGAGKTHALSNRYLKLLHGGVHPASILATTFTRKAAGEILERVLRRLALAAINSDEAQSLGTELEVDRLDSEQARQLLQQVVKSLHRVSISTIDSFFNRVVQSFGLELDVPSDARVLAEKDPVAKRLRRQAINQMLDEHTPSRLLDLLSRLHQDQAKSSVSESIDQIVVSLCDVYRQAPRRACFSRIAAEQVMAKDELMAVSESIRGLAKEERKQLQGALYQLCRDVTEENWRELLHRKLVESVLSGRNRYGKVKLADNLIEAIHLLGVHARGAVLNQLSRRTLAMFDLIEDFEAHYSQIRRLDQVLLFSDLVYRLDNARTSSAQMGYRLDGRIDHLLLDEFQDTSIQQWRILEPIVQEIVARPGGDAAGRFSCSPGSFFCVGDLKQAIYGWRGGCAAIFDHLEADLGLQAGQSLRTSYRSSPIVLGAVNQVFGRLADLESIDKFSEITAQWQEGFEPHEAHHRQRPGVVELLSSAAGEVEPIESKEQEENEPAIAIHLQWVAKRIAALTQAASGMDMGVLVRNNNTISELIRLLREQGVSASGEGGRPLTDDAAVVVVLAALQLADHPGDTAAAFRVRHSPLCAMVGLDRPGDVPAVAGAIRRSIQLQGYAGTISSWTDRLARACDQRSCLRLRQLVSLAEAFDPERSLRADGFLGYVQETRVEEPSRALVRVMTVHTAKGLEFDTVVLPELQARIGKVDQKAWTYRDKPTDPPSAVFSSARIELPGLLAEHLPKFTEAFEQEQRSRLHDDLSVLYVAMTRARHGLHMIVEPIQRNKSGEPAKRGHSDLSFSAILRQALCEIEETSAGAEVLYQRGDPNWARDLEVRSAAPLQPRRLRISLAKQKEAERSLPRLRPSVAADHHPKRIGDLLSIERGETTQRGIVMHRWFEQIEWLDDGVPGDEQLLAVAGPVGGTTDLNQLLSDFRRALTREGIAAVLSRPAQGGPPPTVWRERPFAVKVGSQILHGSFDRVVLHRRSDKIEKADLIDFKTDHVHAGGSNLLDLIERNRPQVEAYHKALAKILDIDGNRITARLLFTSSGNACVL